MNQQQEGKKYIKVNLRNVFYRKKELINEVAYRTGIKAKNIRDALEGDIVDYINFVNSNVFHYKNVMYFFVLTYLHKDIKGVIHINNTPDNQDSIIIQYFFNDLEKATPKDYAKMENIIFINTKDDENIDMSTQQFFEYEAVVNKAGDIKKLFCMHTDKYNISLDTKTNKIKIQPTTDIVFVEKSKTFLGEEFFFSFVLDIKDKSYFLALDINEHYLKMPIDPKKDSITIDIINNYIIKAEKGGEKDV